MAKNDYDVILYKILVYLYACMKRKVIFDRDVLYGHVCKGAGNENYLVDIFRMAQEEGHTEGLVFTKAWGSDYMLVNDVDNMKITPSGIRYLKENDRMKRIGDKLREEIDSIANLAKIVELF